MSFTDINSDHALFRLLPPRFHPYARLARLDRPSGIWFLLFPAWWAIALAAEGLLNMQARDWAIAAAFGAGAVLMRAAGCVINDLWDRDLDKQVERTKQRPLASGELSRKQAAVFLCLLLAASLAILLVFNALTIALGAASLVLVALYPLMKRVTWWPQLFLGFTFNWGVLMGWAAVTGTVGMPAMLLYIACIFWTLGYDTIYAHQDKEDDARAGIKSTARLFGDDSKKWVCGFYAAFIAFLLAAKLAAFPSPVIFFILAALAFVVVRLLHRWEPDNPHSSLQAFKANRTVGWFVLAAISL